MRFGSWCSGIEAASEAWKPLGWECAYVAEIEPFPCSYLAQTYGAGRPRHMPDPDLATEPKDRSRRRAAIKAMDRIQFGDSLTNLGDISQVSAAELAPVDIVAAGFPCQDFSIAGLRSSLGGARGSLSVIGVRLLLEAAELGLVRGALLEQVPDVLNTADNAWGNILGALVGADAALAGLEHGGKWPRAGMVAGPRARVAWRILDAQHFGLAQRRERVWAFVDFGNGPDPAAVLFERKGVHGHSSARRGAGEDVAPTLAGGARKRGGFSYDDVPQVPDGAQRRAAFGGNNTSGPIDVATARTASHTASHTASGRQDFESETFVAEIGAVAYSIMPQNSGKDYKAREVDVAQPLMAGGPVGGNQGGDYVVQPPIAFSCKDYGADGDPCHPLTTFGVPPTLASHMAVRRITVVEAERLQGFRDNATLIRWRAPMRKGDDHSETVAYLLSHGVSQADAEELALTPDGPRYKAIGNSWPVTVARWIGERIEAVDAQRSPRAAA